MAKKKIVFIINSITITRCIKRIEEFIDNGYEVDVYGFERGGEVYAQPSKFNINIIGKHEKKQNYWIRLVIIYKSLRNLFKRYYNQDVLFYYFFFDVAFTARLICRKPFIYEESDLPYAGMKNKLFRGLFGFIDKRIILKSLLTVMTSEGFIEYHFGEERPENIIVVPNRVNPKLVELPYKPKEIDINHLSIAFVGGFRYLSLMNFASVIAEKFPQHDFHVFGIIKEFQEEFDFLCKEYDNIHYHGKFRNPEDLPDVYEQIDLVLATYDATSINAQYAEPNKLYESIFFRTPIIVSSGTFLGRKVTKLGIGYHVDALDKTKIISFINKLSIEDITKKKQALSHIPVEMAINDNPELFEYLNKAIC